MDVFIELLGVVASGIDRGRLNNGQQYIKFRMFCSNTASDIPIYYSCLALEGQAPFNYLETINIDGGDRVFVRGKFQQKFSKVERVVVNRQTMQQEIQHVMETKNRVFINTVSLIDKGYIQRTKNKSVDVQFDNEVKHVSSEREKMELSDDDNPFGD